MKDPDCVMRIMASWMTLDELEGARTRIYFIDSSRTKGKKQFTHRQINGIHFRYIQQVGDHNNWKYAPIYLERKWVTKL